MMVFYLKNFKNSRNLLFCTTKHFITSYLPFEHFIFLKTPSNHPCMCSQPNKCKERDSQKREKQLFTWGWGVALFDQTKHYLFTLLHTPHRQPYSKVHSSNHVVVVYLMCNRLLRRGLSIFYLFLGKWLCKTIL